MSQKKPAPTKRSHASGMPAAKIDPVDFEKLCALQCTHEEIAAWFNVCRKTIERLLKQPKYSELMERGKAKGRISIRRALMKQVDAGNMTAIIWAGKNILGYRDSVDAQITASIEVKEIKVSFITPASPIVP